MAQSVPNTLNSIDATPSEAASIEIHRIAVALRRRLKYFIAVCSIVFAAAAVLTFMQTPMYTATARVLIDQRKQEVTKEETVLSGLPDDSSVVDTEVEILRSRSIAEKVAQNLHLDNDAYFKPVSSATSLLQTLIHRLSPSSTSAARPDPVRQHQHLIDDVLAGLDVERSGETFIIDVNYEFPDPYKAAAIANAFAQAYLEDQLEAKDAATKRATDWLKSRLESLREDSLRAQTAVEAYKKAHNLLVVQGTTLTDQGTVYNTTTLADQEITSLDQQLVLARADEAAEWSRYQTAQSQLAHGSTGEDVGEALNSPVVQALRAQRALASQKVADMEGRYGDRHPDLLKAKRELADVDNQIHDEIQRIISNLEAQAKQTSGRVSSLQADLDRLRGELAKNNEAGVGLAVLIRNADAASALYQSFLDRVKETSAQEGMEPSDARVVSAAMLPTAASAPRKALDLALGALIALVLASAAVAVAELFDRGLSSCDDIERELGIPALVSIPQLGSMLSRSERRNAKTPVDYIVEHPLSGFAEVFRNLRASLLFGTTGESAKVIAITSSLPCEGKTTTALCLARIAALAGDKVVVVDCDLRRRGVSARMPVEFSAGLVEVLSGKAKFDDVINRDATSGAYILPLAKATYTPLDLFGSAAIQRLLSTLRANFDLVILDIPPLMALADSRAIVRRSDAVVLLAHWRKTPKRALENSVKALLASNVSIAGAALVMADQRQLSKYGYDYHQYDCGSYRKHGP
jgi:polysaccharide biosynthesis transport protein